MKQCQNLKSKDKATAVEGVKELVGKQWSDTQKDDRISKWRQLLTWQGAFCNTRCNQDNFTPLTTFSVNRVAGKKNPNQQTRQRKKSPDVGKSMASCKNTLGDALANTRTTQQYSAVATLDLCLTLGKSRPLKHYLCLTTSTPFQLVKISGNVFKCASCGGDLKDDPD